MFSKLPKTTEAQVLGKQMLRSGTSVGANYREAYCARSKAEFIAKCGDSLRELEETAYWLELLVDGKMVPLEKLSALRQECDGDFCYDPEAIEGGFLIHPSSVCLFSCNIAEFGFRTGENQFGAVAVPARAVDSRFA